MRAVHVGLVRMLELHSDIVEAVEWTQAQVQDRIALRVMCQLYCMFCASFFNGHAMHAT
jgi:hypothetical protein